MKHDVRVLRNRDRVVVISACAARDTPCLEVLALLRQRVISPCQRVKRHVTKGVHSFPGRRLPDHVFMWREVVTDNSFRATRQARAPAFADTHSVPLVDQGGLRTSTIVSKKSSGCRSCVFCIFCNAVMGHGASKPCPSKYIALPFSSPILLLRVPSYLTSLDLLHRGLLVSVVRQTQRLNAVFVR